MIPEIHTWLGEKEYPKVSDVICQLYEEMYPEEQIVEREVFCFMAYDHTLGESAYQLIKVRECFEDRKSFLDTFQQQSISRAVLLEYARVLLRRISPSQQILLRQADILPENADEGFGEKNFEKAQDAEFMGIEELYYSLNMEQTRKYYEAAARWINCNIFGEDTNEGDDDIGD